MDVFDAAARVLALAVNGVSHTRILALNHHLSQDELGWLVKVLVDRKLLEYSSSAYWTTLDGIKFVEIHFQIERILRQDQKALV